MRSPNEIKSGTCRSRQGKARQLRKIDTAKLSFFQQFLPIPWSLWPSESRLLITLIAFWSLAGLLILGSASWWVASREMGDGAYYLKRQIIWMGASWSLFFLVISSNLRSWLKNAGQGFWVGLILILTTLMFGRTVNGASRWLVIGALQIQPSELIKPFVILQAANIFANWNRLCTDQKLLWLSSFGILLLLILKQPNLSTAGLIGILIWLIALASGVKFFSLSITALGGLLLGLTSILINDYQRMRIVSFLNPWEDPQGNGYQLVQSLLAIGSGGFFGEGYGLSTQKLQYLPIQSTDFIYAVFAEEFGFVGSVMLLLFLMFIAFLGFRVSLKCNSNQTRLIAIGCTTVLVGQAIMHVAVASGVMPTTGLPLPLVSYGGNSLISSLMIAGLLVRSSLESTGLIGGRRDRNTLRH